MPSPEPEKEEPKEKKPGIEVRPSRETIHKDPPKQDPLEVDFDGDN